MGKIITFWSPMHGQCKTTATAVAVAMSAAPNEDVVITHIQPRLSAMENYFGYNELQKNGVMNDTGLNNLVYNSIARNITEDDIRAACVSVTKNVSLLPALGQNKVESEKDAIISRLIVKELPKYFKYVFIDLGTETGESDFRARPMVKEITDAAAVNFVVLPQNAWLWKTYDGIRNASYIISAYDEDSKFSASRFRFSQGKFAYTIPLCTEYADALSEGRVKEFFERNQYRANIEGKDSITNFIKKISEVKWL